MNPKAIIDQYYPQQNKLKSILLTHSELVAQKALAIAQKHPELKLDETFLYEGALLHDIGIFLTNAPGIECFGTHPYICHGYLGGELLRKAGYEAHARVCERHTGTGITLEMIEKENLPLPPKDMRPETLEEQVICFADKFFSKSHVEREKNVEKVQQSLLRYGKEGLNQFNSWCVQFL